MPVRHSNYEPGIDSLQKAIAKRWIRPKPTAMGGITDRTDITNNCKTDIDNDMGRDIADRETHSQEITTTLCAETECVFAGVHV